MNLNANDAAAEAEIRTLVAAWSRALEARDTEALTAAYTEETVLYDAIPPYRTVGRAAIKAAWDACMPHLPERFASRHEELEVSVGGDMALVHGLHRMVPEEDGHPCGTSSMRITSVFRRVGGRWQVVHEHVSVPFDPMTGQAAFIAADRDAAK